MGWLTTEELVWDGKGRLATHAPATYKIPVASDMPARFPHAAAHAPEPHREHLSLEGGRRAAVHARHRGLLRDPRRGAFDQAGTGQPKLEAPCTPEAILNAIQSLGG